MLANGRSSASGNSSGCLFVTMITRRPACDRALASSSVVDSIPPTCGRKALGASQTVKLFPLSIGGCVQSAAVDLASCDLGLPGRGYAHWNRRVYARDDARAATTTSRV